MSILVDVDSIADLTWERTNTKAVLVISNRRISDDQDLNESFEYVRKLRNEMEAKVILVGMAAGLDQDRLSKLAYASG
ncbi:Protein CBG08381 [Caenorhabditis briggsae]|uniref:Uncharacterized protein n=2 Tax=Caenorhabditis briggsae TaxID=6238 RepID=A0AAE9AIT8_CAEBR|nr:Protein CBG08381 [Caenorhabditis briggsae]ULT97090.1 hypothetical protein L3Y34_005129 [Caenorhabditis briggsae]CAP28215.1 Protein CBG08381 [Caenorhabditis briggsae]